MSNTINIIVPCRNSDFGNCLKTIEGIDRSAGNQSRGFISIDVVLDGPDHELPLPVKDAVMEILKRHASVIHNRSETLGCGGSRHVGAMLSHANWLLFTDSHVQFPEGWMENIGPLLGQLSPHDVLCTTYNSLNSWDDPHAVRFTGARHTRILSRRPDGLKLLQSDLCEFKPGEQTRVQVPVGAGYLVRREFYLRTAPFFGLRAWGGDEEMLALKAWSHGGRVICTDRLNLEHVHVPPPAGRSSKSDLLRNKLLVLATLGMEFNGFKLASHGIDRVEFQEAADFHRATVGPLRDHPLFTLLEEEQGDIEEALEGGVLL